MIDSTQRDQLALLLRRLASGRLPAPDYEDAYYDFEAARTSDRGVREIAYFGWTLFGDLDDRLVGRRAVKRSDRRMVARSVLFLRTTQDYAWPTRPPLLTWRSFIDVFTLGIVRPKDPAWTAWSASIDMNAWPFANVSELEAVKRRWPFSSSTVARAI